MTREKKQLDVLDDHFFFSSESFIKKEKLYHLLSLDNLIVFSYDDAAVFLIMLKQKESTCSCKQDLTALGIVEREKKNEIHSYFIKKIKIYSFLRQCIHETTYYRTFINK